MQYIKIEPPKKKSDWKDKLVCLNEIPPVCRFDFMTKKPIHVLPIKKGDVVRIYMRRKFGEQNWYMPEASKADFGDRIIEIRWKCPHCDYDHALLIPESWIA